MWHMGTVAVNGGRLAGWCHSVVASLTQCVDPIAVVASQPALQDRT